MERGESESEFHLEFNDRWVIRKEARRVLHAMGIESMARYRFRKISQELHFPNTRAKSGAGGFSFTFSYDLKIKFPNLDGGLSLR